MSARFSVRSLGQSFTIILLTGALVACSGGQGRKATHMARGEKYLAAQNYDKASVEFQNVLQIDPKNAQARYELGVVNDKQGHLQQAAQMYSDAIQLAPKQDYLDAEIALARLMSIHGAADRALELAESSLKKHPAQPALLVVRAVCKAQKKQLDAALEDANKALQLQPGNEEAIAVLAGIYKARQDEDKARVLLEGSVQHAPNSPDLRFMLAQVYSSEGQLTQAEAQYKKIIELRPKQGADRIRLAQFYVGNKRIDAAESELRRAVQELPSDRSLKEALVGFLQSQRGLPAAQAELQKMVAAAPDDYDLQFSLARLYQQSGNSAQAEAIYHKIIDQKRLEPVALQARNQLSAVRLQQNDLTGALALANTVIGENPHDNDALLIRAQIELAHNDPRNAIVDLRQVLHDQPDNPQVLKTLVSAHLANNEPQIAEQVLRAAYEANPRNITIVDEFAQLLAQTGKAQEAGGVLTSALQKMPGNVDLLNMQFRIAMTQKDYAQARDTAATLVNLQPKLPLAYMYQGTVAEAEKRYSDALQGFSQANQLAPGAPEPLQAVVRVLAETHRIPEALNRLDEVAVARPQDALPVDLKGQLLIQQPGRVSEAKQAFQQAMALAPHWIEPYLGMAQAQLAAKDDVASIVAGLRQAKANVEQSERVTEVLAEILEKAGKPDDATAEYEEALHKYPGSELLANNLAMLLVTYKTDAASLNRAKDLASRFAGSRSPALRDTYGWVLYKRGEAAAAVPVLTQVVSEAPEAMVARYHLGMAQALAGDVGNARVSLSKAVESGQRFEGLQDAKSELEHLNHSAADVAPKS